MRAPGTGIDLFDGRLHLRIEERLGDVDLNGLKARGRHLLLVVDGDVISDDPICHSIFYSVLSGLGHLAQVNPHQPHELISDLASAADAAACWVSGDHEVEVVVVEPVPLNLTAACVLVATGLAPPAAVTEAFAAAEQVPTASDEIAVQVFATHLAAFRSWHAARRLARQEALQ